MKRARVTVNAATEITSIDPRIYGHFLEPLGRMIQGGVYPEPGSRAPVTREGFRADVMDAVKNLGVTNLRWPGGCFADHYHWRDGIGDNRPARPNRPWGLLGKKWGPVENNRLGTNEFLGYCREIKAEPVFCVNAGSGNEQEAAEWVDYVNIQGKKERPGLPRVRLWDVGNEQFGIWEKGHSSPKAYGRKYLSYRRAMKAADPGIETVAVGADLAFPKWNRQLLETAGEEIDYLSIHTYLPQDYRLRFLFNRLKQTRARYYSAVSAGQTFAHKINTFRRNMRRDFGRPVPLAFDEWNLWWWPGQAVNPVAPHLAGLAIAGILQEFQRNADLVKIANLSSILNILCPPLITTRDRVVPTTVYQVMKLMSALAGDALVESQTQCEPYSAGQWGGIRAVEKAPLLETTATRDTATGRLAVFLLHKNFSQKQEVEICLNGADPGRSWTLHSCTAANPFSDPVKHGPGCIRTATREVDPSQPIGLLPHSFSVLEIF